MDRVEDIALWRHVRGALAVTPVPLRVALATEASLDRRIALDRLSGFLVGEMCRLSEVADEDDGTLPLFPDLDDPRQEDPVGTPASAIEHSTSFGAWLLAQADREDALGAVARQARADPRFPKSGSPKDVSKRLNELGADGDVHMLLEDAELDWLAL